MHLALAAIAGSTHGEIGKTAGKGAHGKPETTFSELVALHAQGLAPAPSSEKVNIPGATSAQSATEEEETALTADLRDAATTVASGISTQASTGAKPSPAVARGGPALPQAAKSPIGNSDTGSKAAAAVSLPAAVSRSEDDNTLTLPPEMREKSSAHDKTSSHDPVAAMSKPEAPAITSPVLAQSLPVAMATPFTGVQPHSPLPESRPASASIPSAKYAPASVAREKDTSVVTNRATPVSLPAEQGREAQSSAAGMKPDTDRAAAQAASREAATSGTAEADSKATTAVTESPASRQAVSDLPAPAELVAKPMANFVSAAPAAVATVPAAPVANTVAGNHLAAAQQVQPAAPSPYQKLDQVSAPTPVMLHASANRVSVGIHDPSLGWIEVKTQAVAGQVSASLVTAASQAHQSLSAQLPSLTQFLTDHEVKVGDVVVQQGTAGGEMSSGSGQRHQQEAGGQSTAASSVESPTVLAETTEVLQEARPLSYISIRA